MAIGATVFCYLGLLLSVVLMAHSAAPISEQQMAEPFHQLMVIANGGSGGKAMCVSAYGLNIRGCSGKSVSQKFRVSSGWPAASFILANEASNLCLDTSVGIQLRPCNQESAQDWTYDGMGRIISSSGQCLDSQRQSVADKTPLALAPCTEEPTQVWIFHSERMAKGAFHGTIASMLPAPGPSACLDAFGTKSGDAIALKPCSADMPSQVISAEASVADAPDMGSPAGAFLLRFPFAEVDGLCLAVDPKAGSAGVLVALACTPGDDSQLWHYDSVGHLVSVAAHASGTCATSAQGGATLGDCTQKGPQNKWLLSCSA